MTTQWLLKMQIRLNHIQFTDVDYKVKTFDKEITHQLETSLSVGSSFPDDTENSFVIIFKIMLQSKSKAFKLKLKAVAHFSTSDLIDDNFKNSPFIEVNAPAIAFPYIRSFISNLTLNSGFDPIILPSFNFVELAEENRNK